MGARLFHLLQYSPDLNPIEQDFAKLKILHRKENARSFEQVEAAIERPLGQRTSQECRNFFAEARYAST